MATEPLRIYVCGRLAIEHGTTIMLENALPGRQGRRLWAYLVLHRVRPVGRGALADALWGDEIPDAWDVTLNAVISRLRRSLVPLTASVDDFAIQGEPGRYALKLPNDAFVDHERARAAIHETDRLMFQGEPAAALAEARVALEIAGRGFLPGEDAPWIEGQRRAMGEIQLHAQERTVEAELARGRGDIAEREAEALVALDPLRESSYRLLMRALAAGGNPARAARVFETCCRTLREQVDAAPSAETKRLARELIGAGA